MKNRRYKLMRNYGELGLYLRDKRREQGLTQKQVGGKLGYSSAQFISNFERGISRPPIKKMKFMAKLCGLNLGRITKLILLGEEKRLMQEFYQ